MAVANAHDVDLLDDVDRRRLDAKVVLVTGGRARHVDAKLVIAIVHVDRSDELQRTSAHNGFVDGKWTMVQLVVNKQSHKWLAFSFVLVAVLVNASVNNHHCDRQSLHAFARYWSCSSLPAIRHRISFYLLSLTLTLAC
jgi:hypothetical protein